MFHPKKSIEALTKRLLDDKKGGTPRRVWRIREGWRFCLFFEHDEDSGRFWLEIRRPYGWIYVRYGLGVLIAYRCHNISYQEPELHFSSMGYFEDSTWVERQVVFKTMVQAPEEDFGFTYETIL
jgi:hypothetical protein